MGARGRVRRGGRPAGAPLGGLRAAVAGDDVPVPRAPGCEMVKQLDQHSDAELRVWEALSSVHDPEIPPLSITDLGIVERVDVRDDEVEVALLPTFSGCPALDVIREDAEGAVGPVAGGRNVRVRFVYSPPWTSDRITPEGREGLRSYGLTPPGASTGDRV